MTTTEKTAIISMILVEAVKQGMEIDEAMDALMGEGSYKKMVGEVYHALRAKQGLE